MRKVVSCDGCEADLLDKQSYRCVGSERDLCEACFRRELIEEKEDHARDCQQAITDWKRRLAAAQAEVRRLQAGGALPQEK
jgi:hypothetical protein